jgi:hypothetical protein
MIVCIHHRLASRVSILSNPDILPKGAGWALLGHPGRKGTVSDQSSPVHTIKRQQDPLGPSHAIRGHSTLS